MRRAVSRLLMGGLSLRMRACTHWVGRKARMQG